MAIWPVMAVTRSDVSQRLAEIGRRFDQRGWLLGTSGNLSGVVEREPLRLAITPSGTSKGELSADQMLEIDATGAVIHGTGAPSAEARLHVEVIRARGAGAVLHTHSIWSTLLSDRHAASGGLAIEGYEMLKGLSGIRTHEHREWVPVVANTQDYDVLSREIAGALSLNPAAHGVLLSGHGLYTWGEDLAEARRHVEILEFLFEVEGRRRQGG
jgi:methylthioribulose-1-phosphate dehydratase